VQRDKLDDSRKCGREYLQVPLFFISIIGIVCSKDLATQKRVQDRKRKGKSSQKAKH
jgi:hypothetical protein